MPLFLLSIKNTHNKNVVFIEFLIDVFNQIGGNYMKISKKKLNEILVNHKHWLEQDVKGWEDMRANLSGIDLSHADLSYADLSYAVLTNVNLNWGNLEGTILESADLSFADLHDAFLKNANLHDAVLQSANLQSANLCDVNLSDAVLTRANLSDTNLQRADLSNARLHGANLIYANLRNANLSSAYLFCANLCFANLKHANLQDTDLDCANLNYADLQSAVGNLIEYRKGKILDFPLTGFMRFQNDIIVTLEIPEGAIVFSTNGKICRTNTAKVVDIDGTDEAIPFFENTTYHVGDKIIDLRFNCIYSLERGSGICFFTNREDAETSSQRRLFQ